MGQKRTSPAPFDHFGGAGEQADDKLKPSAFAVRIYSRAVFAMP